MTQKGVLGTLICMNDSAPSQAPSDNSSDTGSSNEPDTFGDDSFSETSGNDSDSDGDFVPPADDEDPEGSEGRDGRDESKDKPNSPKAKKPPVSAEERLKEKERGADAKFREAATIRKQATEAIAKVNAFVEAIQKDPISVLEKLGVDVEGVTKSTLEKRYKRAQMTPAEIEAEEFRTKYETEKQARERFETEHKERAYKIEVQKHEQEWDKKLSTALLQSRLPRNADSVKRLAQKLVAYGKEGIEVPLESATEEVFNDIKTDLLAIVKDLKGDDLLNFAGAEVAEEFRKALAARYQQKRNGLPHATEQRGQGHSQPRKPQQQLTPTQFRERISQRI